MNDKKKPDVDSPEWKTLVHEIFQGTFVKEGTMVAFPLCFPGATAPIAADESHITALDITPEGIVYGGTSGRKTHLFVGMLTGVTGMVFDLGVVEEADHCAAICCAKDRFVACVNGPGGGGRLLGRQLEPPPFDLLQEWGFSRKPFEDYGEVVADERIVHALCDVSRSQVIGATQQHLFRFDFGSSKVSLVGELTTGGRLAVGSKGNIFGLDEGATLWRYSPEDGALSRKAVNLPEGSWKSPDPRWARDPRNGTLYVADSEGALFSFSENEGFSPKLGRTALAPVGPMAVTFDGRVFGACGDGICKLFAYSAATGEITDLGCAVSVIERRRYGYQFGDAVTGRDGQIIFGEDDDLGHLWLYFPKIETAPGRPGS